MRSTEHFVIHLVGPGGAGKTTTGAALADRLGMPFVDLDAEFATRHDDISTCLDEHGYGGYANETWTSTRACSEGGGDAAGRRRVDELLEMIDLCQTSPSPHRP